MSLIDQMRELREAKEKELAVVQKDIDEIDAVIAFLDGRTVTTVKSTDKRCARASLRFSSNMVHLCTGSTSTQSC